MLRELCIMKITVLQVIIVALRTVLKSLRKKLEELEISGKVGTTIKTSKEDTKMSVVVLRRLVLIECPVQAINCYCCTQTMS